MAQLNGFVLVLHDQIPNIFGQWIKISEIINECNNTLIIINECTLPCLHFNNNTTNTTTQNNYNKSCLYCVLGSANILYAQFLQHFYKIGTWLLGTLFYKHEDQSLEGNISSAIQMINICTESQI